MSLPSPATRWGNLPRPLAWLAGGDPVRRGVLKSRLVQGLVVCNLVLGTRYVTWRVLHSVNWDLWPLGLALLGAELFSYTDSLLFGVNMWRVGERPPPPAAPPDRTVDVFVTTYNEPIELVRETALAARAITYPHRTWVLDDGNRPLMREACEELGVGYLVRSTAWVGKNLHAKAGNLINALYQTSGEFLLVLDADQVPSPALLDRVLGYFTDPNVAFVQTPQAFKNVPRGDPFGSEAPLFYGPIQTGKDGWNSAFFCGSNAVLRREALMQLGLVWYARDLDRRARRALKSALPLLRRARRRLAGHPAGIRALDELSHVVVGAQRAIERGEPLQSVTWRFQQAARQLRATMHPDDLATIRDELALLPGALPADRGEAEPVFPMSTVSVTEDMATAMRLHGLGWASVYHHEVLALGLAPEDLGSSLQQRLRWAQGTLQVMLSENPLVQPGLTLPQRLLYFGTMWSYFSGFASLVYLSAPILFLMFGFTPVKAYSVEFLAYLVPWLIVNQALFSLIGFGLPTWRGRQYSLALFPLWLQAVWTSVGNVYFGRHLGFVVTPKTRQEGGSQLSLVLPQVGVMVLLVAAILVGLGRVAFGWTDDVGPVWINVAWASYDLVLLSVVVVAAGHRPRHQAQ